MEARCVSLRTPIHSSGAFSLRGTSILNSQYLYVALYMRSRIGSESHEQNLGWRREIVRAMNNAASTVIRHTPHTVSPPQVALYRTIQRNRRSKESVIVHRYSVLTTEHSRDTILDSTQIVLLCAWVNGSEDKSMIARRTAVTDTHTGRRKRERS